MGEALDEPNEAKRGTHETEPLAEGGEKHFDAARLGVLDQHILHLVEIAGNLNILSSTGIKQQSSQRYAAQHATENA